MSITLNFLTGNLLGLKVTERSQLIVTLFLLFHNILTHGSPSYTKNMYFHNVHHKLQYCNFSVNTPLMDILFGTYRGNLGSPYKSQIEYPSKECLLKNCNIVTCDVRYGNTYFLYN